MAKAASSILNRTFDNQKVRFNADDSHAAKQKEHYCFIEELCACEEEPIQVVVDPRDPKKKEKANHVISSSAQATTIAALLQQATVTNQGLL